MDVGWLQQLGLSSDLYFAYLYNLDNRRKVWKPSDVQVDPIHPNNEVSNSWMKSDTVKTSKVFVDLNTTSDRYPSYTSFMRHSSFQETCMASHSIVETISLEPI